MFVSERNVACQVLRNLILIAYRKRRRRTAMPIVAEFIAPDGSKVTSTAGKGWVTADADGTDLDKWLRDHAHPAAGN